MYTHFMTDNQHFENERKKRMRRRKRRILAAGMVVVITCSSYGSVPRVYANSNFYQIREIESLSEQVLYQKVPYGTRYQDLEMPDSIDVFVSGGGKMKMCLTQGQMRM